MIEYFAEPPVGPEILIDRYHEIHDAMTTWAVSSKDGRTVWNVRDALERLYEAAADARGRPSPLFCNVAYDEFMSFAQLASRLSVQAATDASMSALAVLAQLIPQARADAQDEFMKRPLTAASTPAPARSRLFPMIIENPANENREMGIVR